MTKDFTPKPLILEALPEGSQSAGDAVINQMASDSVEQTNTINMSGGNVPVTCPQAPTYGMTQGTYNGNELSCQGNGTAAQGAANSQFDNMIGKVGGGRSKSRRHARKSRRHTRKSRRHTRKSRRHTRKSRRHTRKSRRHVRKSRRNARKSRRHKK